VKYDTIWNQYFWKEIECRTVSPLVEWCSGTASRWSATYIIMLVLLSAGWSTTLFHWQGVKLVRLSFSWAMDCAKGPNEYPPRYLAITLLGLLCTIPNHITLLAFKKISMLLLQTSQLRHLEACDEVCSTVSTCARNRRNINFNICFASILPIRPNLWDTWSNS
jgi:hypothetical protein